MHGHALTRRRDEPLSTSATQILQRAVRDDVSVAELCGLAEQDPAFALRLLVSVNSAAFGVGRRVTDARQAGTLLGIRGLRNLALGMCISDMVPGGADGELLFALCLRRAVACRLVAEALGEHEPSRFFILGLLLEVGLLATASSDLEGAIEIAQTPAGARLLRERAGGGDDHPHRGAKIAASYELPESFCAAIAHHHDGGLREDVSARIAQAGERLAAVFEGGDIDRNRILATQLTVQLGLTEEATAEVLRAIPEAVGEAAESFGRQVAAQPALDSLLVDANRSLVALNRSYEDIVRTLEATLIEREQLATRLREANERLKELAATDGLTGLMNRRAFTDSLCRDLARAYRADGSVTLIMLDVDHFKRINDTYGHQAGDEVLKEVAASLAVGLRATDVVGRIGGEEFAIILPGTTVADGMIVAERTRKAVEALVVEGSFGRVRVTASLGLAELRGSQCRGGDDEIIRRADEMLYQAKRAGRNRVVRPA